MTLVGQIERSEDGKSASAIVARSNGEKGVLIASKPGVVALLRAQKAGARLAVVAEVDRSGSQPRLTAQSIRPVVDRAAS